MEGDSDETKKKKMMMEVPLLETTHPKGGFRTLPFIIANESFERVASLGLQTNMILYLMNEYHMDMVTGTNFMNLWSAATNFSPVIGAFLADSLVGRYAMIGVGSIFCFLGTILLWSTTMIPQARPPPCIDSNSSCSPSTAFQVTFLCISFGVMSIGAGGIRSSSLAFGADQLETHDNLKNAAALERYFSWYYAAITLSMLVASTCVVYIQDQLGWAIGFGVPAVLMLVSAVLFFLASPFYIKLKDKTSLLTGFFQVIVASYKNREIVLPSESSSVMYNYKKGSALFVPSDKLRFLNKACIIRDPQQYLTTDGRISDSWNICTVDQVEELKALVKVIPMWSTGMIMSINISQASFPVVQAASMDRRITSDFEIPAASFGTFAIISVILWIALYDHLILPLGSRIMNKPVHLTTKQRMGLGVFFSCLSVTATAIIEYFRRELAIDKGSKMSAMWLILPNSLIGFAEALNAIGQNEFYFSEFPRSMSSIAMALLGVGMSAANLLASLIMNLVDQVTGGEGKPSWVSTDINEGHYDYFYGLLAGLSALNMVYFLVCSWAYGPCEVKGVKVLDEGSEK